jgi:hypothetical protein
MKKEVCVQLDRYKELIHLSLNNFHFSLGLNHEQNLKKMRLLTFMQLAEGNSEMSFDTIQQELQLKETEVEAFIIDGKKFCFCI